MLHKFLQNFKNSFQNKIFKYGFISSITSIFIIAIVILFNIIISNFNWRLDLTSDSYYTLSDKSIEILKSVNKEITIYPLFPAGTESVGFTELINEYPKYSKYINVVYKDPYVFPTFAQKYESIDNKIEVNSIIIESNSSFKVIPYDELNIYETNPQNNNKTPVANNVEAKITSSIYSLIKGETNYIYEVTGHEEFEIDAQYISFLKESNIDHRKITLDSLNVLQKENSVLFLGSPNIDYSDLEIQNLKKFLSENGKAIIMFTSLPENLFPKLNSFLKSYGVSVTNNFIFEDDSTLTLANIKYFYYSVLQDNPILKSFRDENIPGPAFYGATPLEILDEKSDSINITPLITTSEKAYAKTNPNAQSENKEPGDLDGPFNLALLIKDENQAENKITSILLVSSPSMIINELNKETNYMNPVYFETLIKYMIGEDNFINIEPKFYNNTEKLSLTNGQVFNIFLISTIILPLSILFVGSVVVFRRKRRA